MKYLKYYLVFVFSLGLIMFVIDFLPHNIKILVLFLMFFTISMITCLSMFGWLIDTTNNYAWLLFIIVSIFVAYCGITFGGSDGYIGDERYQ